MAKTMNVRAGLCDPVTLEPVGTTVYMEVDIETGIHKRRAPTDEEREEARRRADLIFERDHG